MFDACGSWHCVHFVPLIGMPLCASTYFGSSAGWQSWQSRPSGAASWFGNGELCGLWQSRHAPFANGSCTEADFMRSACSL